MLMMKEMTSAVRSVAYRLSLNTQVADLKKAQDDATARMGSDRVAIFGTADPDFIGFVTPIFASMKPVIVPAGAGSYGTIAVLPEQQHATIEDRYYSQGQPFVMDRAGTGVMGLNILRNGPTPAGYYGGDKLVIQQRVKRYFNNPSPDEEVFTYRWEVGDVRREPRGYAMKQGEALDGSFYPGQTHFGVAQAYGWTFPKGAHGLMLHNPDPYTEAGWSGSPIEAPNDPATKPRIDAVSPSTYTIGSGTVTVHITGENFTDCGFVMFGPFRPGVSAVTTLDPVVTTDPVTGEITRVPVQATGAFLYRFVEDDNNIWINTPPTGGIDPGVWDIIVVGKDGQIAVASQAFTVIDPDA